MIKGVNESDWRILHSQNVQSELEAPNDQTISIYMYDNMIRPALFL